MTEAKLLAGLAGIAIFLAAMFFGTRAIYDAGDNSGAARVQLQWDQDRTAIQKVADERIEQNTKDKETAIANNEGVINDLQTQLNANRDLASTLSVRLRDAESRASASGRALSKANDQLRASSGALNASLEQINGAVADAINECGSNNAKYSALVRELTSQLK